VQGKVSVVTERALSRSEYFEVFLSTLRANGLVAVPTAGGAYRIQPLDTASSQPGRVGSSGAARNQFVTEVIRLRSIDAASAVETIRPLVSREGSVTANKAGNSLVVADFADNVRRVRELVRRIDNDNVLTRVIPLRNAGAREIATSLATLAGAGGASPVSVVAIDSSNSIALRGDAPTVSRFADIVADLDKRAAAGAEIRVVFLQHADAEKLLPVLQQLAGQAVASVTPQVVGAGSGLPSPVATTSQQRLAVMARPSSRDMKASTRSSFPRPPMFSGRWARSSASLIRGANRCWSKRSSSRFRTMPHANWAFSCSPVAPMAGDLQPIRT
jgi:general secretion pathway protein D